MIKHTSHKREYKSLQFEYKELSPGILSRGLTAESKESLKMQNKLVKENFTPRDVFNPENVTVWLER